MRDINTNYPFCWCVHFPPGLAPGSQLPEERTKMLLECKTLGQGCRRLQRALFGRPHRESVAVGDVKKALRLLVSAPLADKGPETIAALKKLHPVGPEPVPVPSSPAPRWSADVVGPALCSFGPGSAAGLFGSHRSTYSSVTRPSRGPFLAPWCRL